MQQMLGEDIPCLSLHDSFIVPARHKAVLHRAMTEEYRYVLNQQVGWASDPVIK
jgi:hypothetical protein